MFEWTSALRNWTMNRALAIRGASGIVLIAAPFAAFGTALLPFVAGFMVDEPGSPLFGLFEVASALALVSMPFLAVFSGIFALKALWDGSAKTLLFAVLMGCFPAVAAVVIHHPNIISAKPKCLPHPPNGPPVVEDVRCLQAGRSLPKR